MRRDPRTYLWDALDASNAIFDFVRGKTAPQFKADRMLRSAVERQFEIVGEALSQLAKSDPETAARIPELGRIVAFRNVLIHGYSMVDSETVWQIIHENLSDLQGILQRLLEASDSTGA